MPPDLLGYVLNALDARARANVEAYLRCHPEAREQVDALRAALEPLSWDRGATPPPELADRTLERVEVEAAQLPDEPLAPIATGGLSWRRPLAVAAVLVMMATAMGVGISWVFGLRGHPLGGDPNVAAVAHCKNNLLKVYVALAAYSDTHNHQFPDAATAVKPPRNAGGLVFSILHDNELLPPDFKLACPGTGCPPPDPIGLSDFQKMSELVYQGWTQSMQNGYAYSVGYRQGDQRVGPRLEDDKPSSQMPLLADSSPPDPLQGGQSLNHSGSGQNVLYCDGHVAFCPSRFVGYNQDDIYLNRANKVAAGIDWSDAVLTSSAVPP